MTQPPTPEIRPLAADDLEAVIAIDRNTGGTSRRGYFEKRLRAATDHPRDHVYVGLHEDGALRGFALAKLVEGEFGKPGASASLDALAVAPEYGHKGHGHRLLEAVQQVLTGKGVTTLTSQVDWPGGAMPGFLGDAGFGLSPRLVLTRSTAEIPPRLDDDPDRDEPGELDYSSPDSDDFTALSRDKVPVRSMTDADLAGIIAIDRAATGADRSGFYTRRLHESLHHSGVRVSLVAELDGFAAGFIMARVDFGEFGRTGPEAVMDAIGVDPGYQGRGVGQALMSQLMANLSVLRVETVRTEIDWNDSALIAYFDAVGFVPAQRITLMRRLG